MKEKSSSFTIQNTLLYAASAFTGVYLIASFFPDSFLWGVHQLAFFDVTTRFLFLGVLVLLALPQVSSRIIILFEKFVEWYSKNKWKTIIVAFVASVLGVLFFHYFAIAVDMYGDTTKIANYAAGREWSFADVFSRKETEPLTYLTYKLITIITGVDWKTAFYDVSIGSGGIFIILAFIFAAMLDCSSTRKVFFLLLWFTAGINQNFFGHMENYSIAYLFNFAILFFAYQQ